MLSTELFCNWYCNNFCALGSWKLALAICPYFISSSLSAWTMCESVRAEVMYSYKYIRIYVFYTLIIYHLPSLDFSTAKRSSEHKSIVHLVIFSGKYHSLGFYVGPLFVFISTAIFGIPSSSILITFPNHSSSCFHFLHFQQIHYKFCIFPCFSFVMSCSIHIICCVL